MTASSTRPTAPFCQGDGSKDGGHPTLKALTGLRFFAALLVLLYHAKATFGGAAIFHWPSAAINVVTGGYVGVSIFFVLSGFILSYNYFQADFAKVGVLKQFWMARLARIYPVYLLGLFVAAPKFLLSGFHPDSSHLAATALSVLSLMQAWVPDFALAWNPPGWSLSAEAFFYLTFPLLVVALRPLRSKRSLLIGSGICWAVALLPPLLLYLLDPRPDPTSSFLKFNPLLRLPEFVLGMCLGRGFLLTNAVGNRRGSQMMATASQITIVLTALFALSLHDSIPKYLVHNGLFDPLFALLIWSLARQGGLVARFLGSRLLVLLGEASYALYILHVPLAGWFKWLGASLPTVEMSSPLGLSVAFLTYLATAFVAAVCTFKWVEAPARRLIRQRFFPRAVSHRASVDLYPGPNSTLASHFFPKEVN